MKIRKLLHNFSFNVINENVFLFIILLLPRLFGIDHLRARLISLAGAIIGRNVKIKDGVSFGPPGSIHNIEIGNDTFVNVNVRFGTAGKIIIGSRCSIGPGCSFETVNHPYDDSLKRRISVVHSIEVGDDVWIGSGVILLPGIHVGAKSILAAGSVVTRDVPANSLFAGVPARLVRYVDGR